MQELRLTSQPQSFTTFWPLPDYTAWWQRHTCVNNNLPGVVMLLCCGMVGSQSSWSWIWHANHYMTIHTVAARMVLGGQPAVRIIINHHQATITFARPSVTYTTANLLDLNMTSVDIQYMHRLVNHNIVLSNPTIWQPDFRFNFFPGFSISTTDIMDLFKFSGQSAVI